jgi:hypothetical protein
MYFRDDEDQESPAASSESPLDRGQLIGITRRAPGPTGPPPAHHRLAAQTALDQRSRSMIVARLGDRPGAG